MPETQYRASRYFRVLGNPTAYAVLRLIGTGRKTPLELSNEIGLHVSTLSATLRNLRQIDLVRYETKWKNKEYWIKDREVLKLLDHAEKIADRMRNTKE